MGFFTVDHSNASGDQVTAGIYEVFVDDFKISTAKSGNTVVNLFYKIRDDVSQKHQQARVMYDGFTETQNAKWKWDTLAKAAGIPNGMSFDSAQSWAEAMVNKDLKIKVVMGAENDKGNSYPEVKGYFQTECPSQGRAMPVQEKSEQQSNSQFGTGGHIDINDDDLPF